MKKSEVNGIAKLLESDEYETAEQAAEAVLKWLEEARAEGTTYAGVIELDLSGPPMYQGVGYFPGAKSALSGIQKHPAAGMAKKIAVVPVLSPKGLTLMLNKIDAPPKDDGVFALIREDAALYKKGWDGKQATRKQFQDLLDKG